MVILPWTAFVLGVFNSASIFAQSESVFENLADIGYFSNEVTTNYYEVNINFLAADSISEIVATLLRTAFAIFGLVNIATFLFVEASLSPGSVIVGD